MPTDHSPRRQQESRAYLTWAIEHLALEIASVGVDPKEIRTAKEQALSGVLNGPSPRSEEHTSELQSPMYLVCRLLLEKKKWRQAANVLFERRQKQNGGADLCDAGENAEKVPTSLIVRQASGGAIAVAAACHRSSVAAE